MAKRGQISVRFSLLLRVNDLDRTGQTSFRIERARHQTLAAPLLCRYSSGLRIAEEERMLDKLKGRCAMSPLMLMLLFTLVPFPVLAIAIVADRWLKSAPKATS